MMRVFWDEWRGSRGFTAHRAFPTLAVATLAALLGLVFQPGALFEVVAAASLVGGIVSGTQGWNEVRSWDWVAREGVRPLAYLAGKVLGWTAVSLVWGLFLLPPLVLVALLWGFPGELVLVCWAWAWVGGLAAQALGHLVTWNAETGPFLGAALGLACLTLSLLLPVLQPLNPLWQVGRLVSAAEAPVEWGSLALVLGITGGLWAVRLPFLKGQGIP